MNTNIKLAAPTAPVAGSASYPSLYRAYLRAYQAYLDCNSALIDPPVKNAPEAILKKPLVGKSTGHTEPSQLGNVCKVCEQSFLSRNGLFDHLHRKKHYKSVTRKPNKILNQPRTLIYSKEAQPEGVETASCPQMVEVLDHVKLVLANEGQFEDLSFCFESENLCESLRPIFQNKDLDFEFDQMQCMEKDQLQFGVAFPPTKPPFPSPFPPKNPTSKEEVPSSPISESENFFQRNRAYSVVTSTAPLDLELFESDSDDGRTIIYTKTEPFVPDFSNIDMNQFIVSNTIRAVDLSKLPILQ